MGQLLPMLANADCCSKADFQALAGSSTEWVVALGREGKSGAEMDAEKIPRNAATAEKLQPEPGKAAYCKRE